MPLGKVETLTISALDRDGIALAQQLLAAGYLTITLATLPNGGQRPSIYSAGNLSGVNFTFVGPAKGLPSQIITYTVAGPNATTVALPVSFASITSVYADGAVASDVEVGWVATAETTPFIVDVNQNPCNIGFGCSIVSSGSTYTVQHTFDDVFAADFDPATATWFDHPDVAAETLKQYGSYTIPIRAVRLYAITAGATKISLWQSMVVG